MFDKDVEKDLLRDKESGHLSKSTVRARCPECYKLFAIHASEVKDSHPQFACTACDTQFWLAFPEALESDEIVMGLKLNFTDQDQVNFTETVDTEVLYENSLSEHALSEDVLECPKCDANYSAKDKECKSCGLIFSKYFARLNFKRSELDAPKEVRLAWDETIENYDDFAAHQKFINLTQRYQSLDYAFDQYEKVLEVNPMDEYALRAQNQLSCLAVTMAEAKISTKAKSKRDFPRLRLVSLLYVLSVIIIVMGIFFPQLRNLVGFGSAVLFLTLALRFYFRII